MIKKTILLTGAGGMVGQNLLEHQDISSYDILTPRSSELDLRDFEEVKKNLTKWSEYFNEYKGLIFHGNNFKDIETDLSSL